jgi:hypothetical protein
MNTISKVVAAAAVTALTVGVAPGAQADARPSVTKKDSAKDLRGSDRAAKRYAGRDVTRATWTVSKGTLKTVVRFEDLPAAAKTDRRSTYVVLIEDGLQRSSITVSPRWTRPHVSLATEGKPWNFSGRTFRCGSYAFSVKHSTLTIRVPRTCLIEKDFAERPLTTPRFRLTTLHLAPGGFTSRARDDVRWTRRLDLR